ncbi:hypothetical protein ABPG72_012804 [Tetrahymena utriculariae]
MSLQFSVTTPVQILNSPVNNSPSKFQFSFSKSPRFLSPKKPTDSFYDLPSQKSNRRAGFGVGSRPDFTKSQVCSPPSKYDLPSQFDKQRSTSRGKSFGTARDKMSEFGIVKKGPLSNPGPGSYQHGSINLNENLSFTMRPKTRDVNSPLFLNGQSTVLQNPGPGQYQNYESINKLGKFQLAKYRSSGATTFNPPRSKRFPKSGNINPGPGQYKPRNDLEKSGSYVLSIYKSYGTRNFSNASPRQSFVDQASKSTIYKPGPGTYRLPSEFGNYDHLDMYRTTSARSSRSTSVKKNLNQSNNNLSQVDFYASTASSKR